MGKNDPRILAIVTRELVAAEACYHKSCYRDYTRNIQGAVSSGDKKEEDECPEYTNAESQAYENFFTYIETRLLQNPRIVRMVELYTLFTSFLKSQGVKEIKESTRTHFRRNLEGEFRDTLDFEDLISGNKRIFVIPRSLSRLDLAKQVMESCDCSSSTISSTEEIWKTALHLRETIQSQEIKASWPPQPCEVTENAVTIPHDLKEFLFTLLTGNTGFPGLQSCSVSRLITSFGQDLVFGASGGRQKPPKHILLPYAVKSLTNDVELIHILNRCGHGIAYSQLEEINTALCLQKLAVTSRNEVPLPDNIRPFINTTLAWDKVSRRLCLVKVRPTESMESRFKLINLVPTLNQFPRRSS